MITKEQFLFNYNSMLSSHDDRSKAIVTATNDARELVRLLGGSYTRTARDINVIEMPNEKVRYFTDDELLSMTRWED